MNGSSSVGRYSSRIFPWVRSVFSAIVIDYARLVIRFGYSGIAKATPLVNGKRRALAVSVTWLETRTTNRYAYFGPPNRHSPSTSSVGKAKDQQQEQCPDGSRDDGGNDAAA